MQRFAYCNIIYILQEIDFDAKYRDKAPEEIISDEVKNSIKTVVTIRDKGKKEENKLRAAFKILDKFLPEKQQTEHIGKITFEVINE